MSEREAFVERFNVSHETSEKLAAYVALLEAWRGAVSLVSRGDMPHLWARHISPSAEILKHAPPDARSFLDLGSGAGFPGLVFALMLADREGAEVALIESNARKAAFLREAVRITRAPARVIWARIQDTPPFVPPPDVITARALASLPRLLALSEPFFGAETIGLFPKPQDAEDELTQATKYTMFACESLSDAGGCVLRVKLERKAQSHDHKSLQTPQNTGNREPKGRRR